MGKINSRSVQHGESKTKGEEGEERRGEEERRGDTDSYLLPQTSGFSWLDLQKPVNLCPLWTTDLNNLRCPRPILPLGQWEACRIITRINKEITFMNVMILLRGVVFGSSRRSGHRSKAWLVRSLSGNESRGSKNYILWGVNWARPGLWERWRDRQRGWGEGRRVREKEREPGGLISDYNLALSKHKISLNPKERGMIKDKRIGIKYKELRNTPLVLCVFMSALVSIRAR